MRVYGYDHKQTVAFLFPLLFLLAMTFGCAATPTAESTGGYIDDSVITAKVKTAIVQEQSLQGFDIHVHTFKGVVQLSGFVDSQNAVNRAGQIASTVAGIQKVENGLLVKPKVAP